MESEELLFLFGPDGEALLERFVEGWGQRMNARVGPETPTGWCSWYYYFGKVSAADVLENAQFLARRRADFPVRYIQLDAGYFTVEGDWLSPNERFPDGLAALAAGIRAEGFVPALWVAPFMAAEHSELLRAHPEWMIHSADGEVMLPLNQGGVRMAALDGTHPEVAEHFRQLFGAIRAMGFDYVKLDFLMLGAGVPGGVRYDRRATRAQALRRGMEAIRAGFGVDGYMLGCTGPFGPLVGLVDGMRVATDITPYWSRPDVVYDEAPAVPNVCRNVVNRAYLHRRLWHNDPDALIVREDDTRLSAGEARLWCDAVRFGGGLMMLGDRLPQLSAERTAWLREALAEPDAYACRPLDRWERSIPEKWLAKHRTTGRQALCLFNFSDESRKHETIDLPPHQSVVVT